MSFIDPFSTASAAGGTVLNTISNLFNLVMRVNSSSQQNSLSQLTSAARVEPLVIIGGDCIHVDFIDDVMQSLHSQFTAYYLQAVSLTSTIDKVQIVKTLDRLNPNRAGSDFGLNTDNLRTVMSGEAWKCASESYTHRLPTGVNKLAVEAEKDNVLRAIDKDAVASVNDLVNLSVGRMINVTLRNENTSVQVPMSIRLLVNQIPERSLEHLLTMPSSAQTVSERYHAWRAGRISLINDLILCQDMIDEHKKALMNDKAGVYSEIMKRANNHKTSGFMTKSPSLASASNIFVISDATAATVEAKLGGKLSNARIRDKIFSSGYGMIIAVINREWENVTFYTRGLSSGTTLGRSALRSSNKGSGPDVMDIMKAFTLGNNPSF